MGLLDVPFVDNSLIRTLSYISTLCAFGSVITVLLVICHCRRRELSLPEAVSAIRLLCLFINFSNKKLTCLQHEFLSKARHKTNGFQSLAIAYSLPGALLGWRYESTSIHASDNLRLWCSILSLLSAFMAMCMTSTASDSHTRIFIGVAAGIILVLTSCCGLMFWDKDMQDNSATRLKGLAAQLIGKLQNLIDQARKPQKGNTSPV
jgi:hypothetical protein